MSERYPFPTPSNPDDRRTLPLLGTRLTGMSEGNSETSGLERARSRRQDLLSAMETLEGALAAPARDHGPWLTGVRAALTELGPALQAHVDEVEGSTGLLPEIRESEPRLSHLVDDLEAEHPSLLDAFVRLNDAAAGEDPDPRLVRRRAVTLLGRLTMHRQAGADLVYEAYQLDIGGGG